MDKLVNFMEIIKYSIIKGYGIIYAVNKNYSERVVKKSLVKKSLKIKGRYYYFGLRFYYPRLY